jgi:hypothetical protein
MPVIAPAVATGISGFGQILFGGGQRREAARRRRLNIRPTFNIQDEYFNNVNLAENMARSGLPEASQQFYTTNAERGLSAGLDVALRTGAGNISSLYDTYNRGISAIAARDAELRDENLKYLIGRNLELADQKTQKWVIDKYEPYKDEARAISELDAAGTSNQWNGINTITGALSAYGASQVGKPNISGNSTDDSLLTFGQKKRAPYLTASQPVFQPLISGTELSDDPLALTSQDAIDEVFNKYRNSPYVEGMYNYFNPMQWRR